MHPETSQITHKCCTKIKSPLKRHWKNHAWSCAWTLWELWRGWEKVTQVTKVPHFGIPIIGRYPSKWIMKKIISFPRWVRESMGWSWTSKFGWPLKTKCLIPWVLQNSLPKLYWGAGEGGIKSPPKLKLFLNEWRDPHLSLTRIQPKRSKGWGPSGDKKIYGSCWSITKAKTSKQIGTISKVML